MTETLLRQSRRRLDLTLVAVLIALYAVALAGMAATRIDTPSETWSTFALILTPIICVSLCCRILGWKRVHAPIDAFTAMLAVTLPLFILSYCAIRLDQPMVDDRLVALDAALGFDWLGVLHAVDANAVLSRIFAVAYDSLGLQLMLLPIYFAMFRDPSRSGAMFVTYAAIVAISCLVAAIVPSIGAYTYYHLNQSDLAHVDAGGGLKHLAEFQAIRTSDRYLLAFSGVAGLITFPSVHAAAAVMCAWISLGSRVLRWPLVILNGIMFIAATTNGGHYLLDLIGGLAIALVAMALARMIFPRATIAVALRDERRLYWGLKQVVRHRTGGNAIPQGAAA